ncbi:HD domain-containing protein [Candidatus Saganbacteria bacterium]|nr:HD domain-containing protein [Candidatus Saganbacteria bacterium]
MPLKKSKINKDALAIVKTLKANGYKCYLVGGCVRDLMLKITPNEWDITTDATPDVVSKLFKKVIPTGIKFGTVTVLLNNTPFEVTTFRKDEKYFDGRHPENVKFTKKLEEDLLRRDFTINAMAYDPIDFVFFDLFSGIKDLKNKTIRAVGDSIERFKEDGLRPVRACRFAAQLGFVIDKKTFNAIPKVLKVVKMVSIERVHDELVKILKTKKPSVGLDYLDRAKIMRLFIPEIVKMKGVKQPLRYHKYDVYFHSLYSCDRAPRENLIVRLAALLHDIAKPKCRAYRQAGKKGITFYNHDKKGVQMAENILKRLKFSNEIIKKVSNLVSNHMFNYDKTWGASAIRRFIKRVGIENIDDLFLLRRADMFAMRARTSAAYLKNLEKRINKVFKEENALRLSDLKINGRDIMSELKIKPGPQVGKILNKLLEKVLDDPSLNERKKLLRLIRETF